MRHAAPIALTLVSVTAASAAVHRVPEDYGTIYEAVDAAAAGDSVLIGPGTWTERDTRTVVHTGGFSTRRAHAFLKPGLSIIGTGGSASTVLWGDAVDPSYGSTILDLPDSAPGDPIIVQGLTLRGRIPGYHGVYSTGGAGFEFHDCILESNTTAVFSRSSVVMRDCTLRGNDATSLDVIPSGIDGRDGDWDFEGCLFESNVAGTLLLRHGGTGGTTIRNCRFIGNEGGRVIRLYDQVPLLLERNWFEGNIASPESRTGFCVSVSDCDGLITGNTFVNNLQPGVGAGILSIGAGSHAAAVVSNTIYGTVTSPGSSCAGLSFTLLVPGQFHSNIITGCRGGPAVHLHPAGLRPTGGCNVFWDNDSGDFDNYMPQPTDVHVDPLFCDAPNRDFRLSILSPCLPGGVPTCGLIGAWDQGCGGISVSQHSWGEIKNLYRTEE